jgi:SsrA-binding protein
MKKITNKKARYEYFLNRSENAGIILSGPEVKSIRKGNCSLKEAYCTIDDNEVFIRNMHISGSTDPTRTRKLLLKKKEISKLKRDMTKGMTLIPYQLFQNDRGLMKIEIFLAKGKKLYDKREVIKKRDLEKDNDE